MATFHTQYSRQAVMAGVAVVIVVAAIGASIYQSRQKTSASETVSPTPSSKLGARLFFDPASGSIADDGTLITDMKISCDAPKVTTVGVTLDIPNGFQYEKYSIGQEPAAANGVGAAPRSAFNMPVTEPQIKNGKLVFALVNSTGGIACQERAAQVMRLTFRKTAAYEGSGDVVLHFARNGEMDPEGTGGTSVLTESGESILYSGDGGTSDGAYTAK